MKKLLTLSALLAATVAPASAITLLVNFGESGDAANDQDTAAAADYAAQDANVQLTASVVSVIAAQQGGGGIPPQTISGVGNGGLVSAEFGGDAGSFGFNVAEANDNSDLPILDSYIANGVDGGLISFTLSSLEEIATGDDVTLTIYGVGDASDHGATISFAYDGAIQTGTQTDAGQGPNNDGTPVDIAGSFSTFTFEKLDGVDEVSIAAAGQSRFKGINGFSLTAPDTVPEPSGALLGFLGLGFLARRRR